MATATLDCDLAPAAARELPAVWRRKDSYLLAATVMLEIGLAATLLRLSNYVRPPWINDITSGALLGQCFLLGLWGALGGLKTVPRWLLVGLTWIVGTVAFQIANEAPSGWEQGIGATRFTWQQLVADVLESMFEALAISALIVSGFACLLLPLRRLAGWRLDFDAAYYRAAGGRRGQLGMMDFAGLLCACTFPLSLIRLLAASDQAALAEVLEIPLLLLVFVPTASLAAAAVMSRRRVGWRLAAAVMGVLLLSCLHSRAADAIPALSTFSSSYSVWGVSARAVCMHCGMAAVIVLTLGGLRVGGLSLIAVGQIK